MTLPGAIESKAGSYSTIPLFPQLPSPSVKSYLAASRAWLILSGGECLGLTEAKASFQISFLEEREQLAKILIPFGFLLSDQDFYGAL